MNILNTTKINAWLENIISKSEKKLTIISPYIKLNPRLEIILFEIQEKEIDFNLVYGKNFKLDDQFLEKLKQFKNIKIYHNKDLHAKIYTNEKHCLITSMNLYDFSQNHNYEIGSLLNAIKDEKEYIETVTICERIIKGSKQIYPKKEENDTIYKKLTITKLAKLLKVEKEKVINLFHEEKLIYFENNKIFITQKGRMLGGELKKGPKTFFTIWPKDIIEK